MPEKTEPSTEQQSLLTMIRPTPLERLAGRIMRAPDHDAGSGDDASGGDGGGDATASGDGDAGKGDGGNGADDASLIASASADEGAGDGAGDGKAGDGDGKDDQSKDGADGLPEKYDINVTVKGEDGKDQKVDLDPALVDAATPVFKELGLGNEQANKIAALIPTVQQRMAEQQNDEFAKTKADWAKQTQNDEEIGGKNWKETKGLVGKALDHFVGGPEKNEDGTYKSGFRQLLEDTGLTNHPDMARMLRAVGAGLSEDGVFARGDGKVEKKSREEVLYPDDVPKK
jgi:hypothetical protein